MPEVLIEGDPELAAELLKQVPAGGLDALAAAGGRLRVNGGMLELIGPEGETLSVTLRASSGRPALLRAALAGSRPPPLVADATAGLGADAFDLATAGCRVVAFEQSAAAWLLLQDGLRRARLDPALSAAAERIALHHGDAVQLLDRHGPFDVVYLDPMFEPGRSKAGKRKSMRLLHLLGAAGGDEAALLTAARSAASRRVAVKRALRAPPLAGVQPSGSLKGRTIRFDLYAAG